MRYLDDYGKGDAQLEKVRKAIATLLVLAIVAGGIYYVFFRNWREERQVRHFLAYLQEGDYAAGYQLWGCSTEDPCRYYPYEEFMEDWGRDSPIGTITGFSLGRSYDQQSGVLITLEINGKRQSNLWVEKKSKRVGFSPY